METGRIGGRIELTGLSKRFGTDAVLNDIDLTIEAGELFSLLGPSGCGKTTTLRVIGGFETADEGSVRIDGVDMAGVAPEKRPVNTVFQSYALFPHLSVADNVGFGLRFQAGTKAERRRRVGEALELVQMGAFAERRPHQLSGGQQQRVALARALVLRPRVLLLDEPLGALDAKLRRTLQLELKQLHREVGITFVYVTHDQEEALTMSDRLAVMREGQIEQIGRPQDVYDDPESVYVADFLGLANLLPASAGRDEVVIGGTRLPAETNGATGECTVFVRPERVRLDQVAGADCVACSVSQVVFVGAVSHVHVDLAGHRLQVVVPNDGSGSLPAVGDHIGVRIPADAIRLLAT
jgi:spermidine/putrescine transport system ATP-binding protein